MDCSTPVFPVHHQLPELAQTQVHWVSDAIQSSHPLSSTFTPAFNLSQYHRLFQWVSSLCWVAKILEFQLQHQSFQWTFRLLIATGWCSKCFTHINLIFTITCSLVCVLSHFSHVWFFVFLWTVAYQAPLSMGFSRQEYWSGLPCPPPWDLLDPGIKPSSLMSLALAGGLFTTRTTFTCEVALLGPHLTNKENEAQRLLCD